jgi:hypothetical protein
MATKTPLSTKVIKAIKHVCSPKYSSVVLLSDEEDENKMETSSVDMFADSGRALSKDLSNGIACELLEWVVGDREGFLKGERGQNGL